MSVSDKVLQLKQDFDDVYEAGQKERWNFITNNGTRRNCNYEFCQTNLSYFEPYTDLQPEHATYMFSQTGGKIDLVEKFEKYGTKLDFSNCTVPDRCFYISNITRVGVIDCTKFANLNYFFMYDYYLHTIDKMIVPKGLTYNNTFTSCTGLVEIRFEGEIGNNINFADCKNLSHDSLMSIINHLETKTSGTFTLSIGSTNLAKLSDAEKAVATEKGWTLA